MRKNEKNHDETTTTQRACCPNSLDMGAESR